MDENQNSLKSFGIHVLLLFGTSKTLEIPTKTQHIYRIKNQKQTEDEVMSSSK